MHANRTDDPTLDALLRHVLPECNARQVQIHHNVQTVDLTAGGYWDGGSRRIYHVVRLDTFDALPIPSAHPAFERERAEDPALRRFRIPENAAVVVEDVFCGKLRLEVLVPGSTAFLPPPAAELTPAERAVLDATCSYKSSYGGIADFRKHEAMGRYKLTSAEVDAARESLQSKGLLDRRMAVTNAGRNAREASRA